MKRLWIRGALGVLMAAMVLPSAAKTWTLKDCVDYALANNISLRKAKLTEQSAWEDVKQSQAALLPSLDFSTSQAGTYRPWPETGSATVANGYVQSSVDKVYYNGSYSLSGNWTVWNGGRNVNTVKQNELSVQQAELDSAQAANSILEQIAQLYVQILYSADAIEVCKDSYETSRKNEERGQKMYEVGKMSRADVAQLTAQRAQDEYNVVEAESNLRSYKRQLKQLLQIVDDEEFDVAVPETTDAMALQPVPDLNTVYLASLETRPEIKNAQLGIESSEIGIKLAKAERMPTVGLNAGVSTNTTSMSDNAWGTQLKNNFNVAFGLSVSVPIFDNRSARTSINKAQIQRQTYLLDLEDQKTTLYSTVEDYWLQAVTNQNKYIAAKESTKSAQESYDLLSAQFEEGLKNIVELMTGKNALLSAQQSELQSKYLTILNLNMLTFYETGQLK